MTTPSAPQPSAVTPTCYRHPDRMTQVSCTRCDRFICTDCMRSSTAGLQCVDCVRAAEDPVPQPHSHFGGRRAEMPVLSYGLIVVSVLAFAAQSLSAGLARDLVLWSPAVADGQFYRLATSAFLHYGVVHLLLNMWALYVVGPSLEIVLGRLRFGALYALSALGGSVIVYLFAPLNAATAGASGAVFGLFGATFVVGRRLRVDVGWAAAVIVINLAFSFSIPNISWQGHVGGLLTGTLVALAYAYAPHRYRNLVQAAVTLGIVALFTGLVWWRTTELANYLGLG